jgi:hypothetical protein
MNLTTLITFLVVAAFTVLVTAGSLVLFSYYQPPEDNMGISLKDEPNKSSQAPKAPVKRKPPTQKRKPAKRKPGKANRRENYHTPKSEHQAGSGIIPAQRQKPKQVAGIDLNDLGDFTMGYERHKTADPSPNLDVNQINAISTISFTPSSETYSKLVASLDLFSRGSSIANALSKDDEFIQAVDDLITKHFANTSTLLDTSDSTDGFSAGIKTNVRPSNQASLRNALGAFNNLATASSDSAQETQLLAAVDQLVAARIRKPLNTDDVERTILGSAEPGVVLVDSTLLTAVEGLFDVLKSSPTETPNQAIVLDDKLLVAVDELVAARVGQALAPQEEVSVTRAKSSSEAESPSEADINIALNDAVNKLLTLRDETANRSQDAATASAKQAPKKPKIDFSKVNKNALIKDLYDISIEYVEDGP